HVSLRAAPSGAWSWVVDAQPTKAAGLTLPAAAPCTDRPRRDRSHAIASPASEGHVVGVEAAALIACAVRARADKRDLLDDDHNLAPLLAVLLPPLLLEASGDADLPPFGEVLGRKLGQLAPEREVEPVGLLPIPSPWHGDGAGRHRRAVLRVAETRSCTESPDQRNSVHINASCSYPGTSSGCITPLACRHSSTMRPMRSAAALLPCRCAP